MYVLCGVQSKVFKQVFDSPFTFHWPTVSEEDNSDIIQHLVSFISTCLSKSSSPLTLEGQQDGTLPKATSTTVVCPRTSPVKALLKPWICFGVNEVARALERQQLQAVLIWIGGNNNENNSKKKNDLAPLHLIHHLACLAAKYCVPLCPLHEVSSTQVGPSTNINSLAQLFQLPNLIAIGFKTRQETPMEMEIVHKDNEGSSDQLKQKQDDEQCQLLLKTIVPKFPKLNIPWIDDSSKHKLQPLVTHTVTSSIRQKQQQTIRKQSFSDKQQRVKPQAQRPPAPTQQLSKKQKVS
jgi:hypothetical protein